MIIRDDINQRGQRACATRPARRETMHAYASSSGRRDMLRATAMTRHHSKGLPAMQTTTEITMAEAMTSDPILGKCPICKTGDLQRIRTIETGQSAIQCDECGGQPSDHTPRYDGQLIAVSGNCAQYMLVDRAQPNPYDVSKPCEIVELFCAPAIAMPPSVWAEYRGMVEDALLGHACALLRSIEHMTPCWHVLEERELDPIESRMIITIQWAVRSLARNCGAQPPVWLSDMASPRDPFEVIEEPADDSDTPECGCGEPTCLGTCGYREEAQL